MSSELNTAPEPSSSLVLRQLSGIRREMAVLVERSERTIELVNRSRAELADLRSDHILMENKLVNQQTEMLTILRRLDEFVVRDGDKLDE